ncbi:MAG: hypothetical protein EOM13_10185, partial [Clostridia bacterium]|nr:hypothetical protein [Clostridia bacterium]
STSPVATNPAAAAFQLTRGSGRVLALTAVAETLEEAINKAYQGMESIRFTGMQMRKDIGQT